MHWETQSTNRWEDGGGRRGWRGSSTKCSDDVSASVPSSGSVLINIKWSWFFSCLLFTLILTSIDCCDCEWPHVWLHIGGLFVPWLIREGTQGGLNSAELYLQNWPPSIVEGGGGRGATPSPSRLTWPPIIHVFKHPPLQWSESFLLLKTKADMPIFL